MTDHTSPEAAEDADRIREQAAAWIARLERRSSPHLRHDLDRWLAADPRHAAAYHRIGQRFGGARMLRSSRRYSDRPMPTRRSYRRMAIPAAVFAIAVFLLIVLLPHNAGMLPGGSDRQAAPQLAAANPSPANPRRLDAAAGSIHSIGLEDGSIATLDAASAVEIAFSSHARQVKLLRGRVRFDVAHDGRPFTVLAGDGSVTARGTVFDVSLSPSGKVGVTLLRGIVDVMPIARPAEASSPRVRRLLAGEAVGYSRGGMIPAPAIVTAADAIWADRAVEFDNVSLGFLLDRANQTAATPIRVVDPAIANLRVSGRFEVGDTARLAESLARLFDLRVNRQSDRILLRRD